MAHGYPAALSSLKKAFMRDSREAFLRAKTQKRTPAGYRLPASISVAALLDEKQSDRQFRRLIRNLLTVTRRLELARDCFGRQINVTGPQYNLLMTVAELQGAAGVSVGSVAQAMHVSSSFVTAETGKLSDVGLLKKKANPSDRRGALLKLTPLARTKIHRLLSEIRAVNDLFFGLLTAKSFTALCAGAEALVEGSREAIQYIARIEEKSDN
jgi:MarR family transcriptional regulator, organic hydroperoxide resistance regulator